MRGVVQMKKMTTFGAYSTWILKIRKFKGFEGSVSPSFKHAGQKARSATEQTTVKAMFFFLISYYRRWADSRQSPQKIVNDCFDQLEYLATVVLIAFTFKKNEEKKPQTAYHF